MVQNQFGSTKGPRVRLEYEIKFQHVNLQISWLILKYYITFVWKPL